MQTIYNDITKRYDETVANIIQQQDTKEINFPLIARKLDSVNFRSLLSPELADKLNLMVEEPPTIEMKEEEKTSDAERGGLVG